MKIPAAKRGDRAGGFSLVEILVGVAILGVIAVIFGTFMTNMSHSEKHLELSSDRLAIHDAIVNTIDCPGTIASMGMSPATCTNGTLINLYKKGGGVIVSATNSQAGDTKIGAWTVRATCYNSGSAAPGIHVDVARPTSVATLPLSDATQADFAKDPLTSRTASWSDSLSPLFQAGAELCMSSFVASSCPSTGSAMAGGNPLELGGVLSNDPTQCTAVLSNIPGVLLAVNNQGQKTCRYYAPLVRGGNVGCAKDGPTPWMTIAATAGQAGDHYGNTVSCPSGWQAVNGGVTCDFASTGCNSSGGFITSNWGDTGGSWVGQCMVFYKSSPPNCQHEAIALGNFADCQEQ